ncbi:MAG TPA: methenyltetrahydrofolate cyclohydrolase, partial [Thermoplasmatales archaeon]|nr:methenyltetrahydrofolate cyclohydrolase [Thermoplasmatales archaeon]
MGEELAAMVCNLTIGKKKYSDVEEEMKKTLTESERIKRKLEKLVEEDTKVFNEVMKAFSLPKETEEEKNKRREEIQKSLKTAAFTPLKTAEYCMKILDLAYIVADKGNKNSITDAGVSALLAYTGAKGAILNVEINLASIKDKKFVGETKEKIEGIRKEIEKKKEEIMDIVEKTIGANI